MRVVPKRKLILILPFLSGSLAKAQVGRIFCRKIKDFSKVGFVMAGSADGSYTIFTPLIHQTERKSSAFPLSIMEWESQEKGIEGDLFDVSMSEPMYILTNQDGFKGAAAVLYEGVLKEFAEQEGCDLLILPSSIHEMILVPYKKSMEVAELGEMVKNINQTTLLAEEILSDSVYLYSREMDQVTMAYGETGRQE